MSRVKALGFGDPTVLREQLPQDKLTLDETSVIHRVASKCIGRPCLSWRSAAECEEKKSKEFDDVCLKMAQGKARIWT